MTRCARCYAQLPGGTSFCPVCGTRALTVPEGPTEIDAGTPPAALILSRPTAASGVPATAAAKPATPSVAAGTLLAGCFRVLALAGRGGMGEVYRAWDLKLEQEVAVKCLPEAVSSDAGRLARLLQEVRIARGVSHPNVCRVYDVAEGDGR